MPTAMSQAKKKQSRAQLNVSLRIDEMLSKCLALKESLKDDIRETLVACEDAPVLRGQIRAVATARIRRKIILRFKFKLKVEDAILKRAAGLSATRLLDEIMR